MVLRRARVGQAAVHVLADPRRLLLGQAGHEQRQGRAIRGQHVQALRQVRGGAFAQQCDLLAEAAATAVEVAAEQRVLHRAVATGTPSSRRSPLSRCTLRADFRVSNGSRIGSTTAGAQQDVRCRPGSRGN
jgi:hypothetical protein